MFNNARASRGEAQTEKYFLHLAARKNFIFRELKMILHKGIRAAECCETRLRTEFNVLLVRER